MLTFTRAIWFLVLSLLVILSAIPAEGQFIKLRGVTIARGAGPVSADDDEDAEELQALDPAVAKKLDAALRDMSGALDQDLRKLAHLTQGSVEPLIRELESIEKNKESLKAYSLARVLVLKIRLLQPLGDLDLALGAYGKLEDLAEGKDNARLNLEVARLLDARGKLSEALVRYARALQLGIEPQLESFIRLRIALIQADQEVAPKANDLPAGISSSGIPESSVLDGLVEFALSSDQATKNRCAVVLAARGNYLEATSLFVPQGEGSKLCRDMIRMGEWLAASGQYGDAEQLIWDAIQQATSKRDRRYALSVLVEVARKGKATNHLLSRFRSAQELDAESREVWIDLLRNESKFDEALELFKSTRGISMSVDERRQLLDLCRDVGRDGELVTTYRRLLKEEPKRLEWREGLTRFFIERGRNKEIPQVWQTYLDACEDGGDLIQAAEVMMSLGLDEMAEETAQEAHKTAPAFSMFFLYKLFSNRGRLPEAEAVLSDLENTLPAASRKRVFLAEAWEAMRQRKKAADTYAKFRLARGPGKSGEDVDMRLAWLYSEIDRDDLALELWRELWETVKSIPRQRYVADRYLSVAARSGTLADIALDLEKRLIAKTATQKDTSLLVNLYTKANDAVSAAEVIAEAAGEDRNSPEKLQQMARVYLSCADYANYERVIRKLITVDPEGESDYLRQLAMSALERARPLEAKKILHKLLTKKGGAESAEFEAGVLSLAGLDDEAIQAYRKGLAANPNRIESYLLLANIMAKGKQKDRAVGMFQHLIETAQKDDLFTVAIDGLLNMEAARPILTWARRMTLERIAHRHDKTYLYQLVSDLSEEIGDKEMMRRAMEATLANAGARRASVLRELMELVDGAQGKERRLDYGRRLMRLGDLVPPDVYLNLGGAFLAEDDIQSAQRTFAQAVDVPDYASFQRKVGKSFEAAGYKGAALKVFQRVLIGLPGEVGLLKKVALLQEEVGRDDVAADIYLRAIDLMLLRRPLQTAKEEKKADDDSPFFSRFWGAANLDDYDQFFVEVQTGFLVTSTAANAELTIRNQTATLNQEMELAKSQKPKDESLFTLRRYPRILARSQFVRRLAQAFGLNGLAASMDQALLTTFDQDKGIFEEIVGEYVKRGNMVAARTMITKANRSEDEMRRARFKVGVSAGEKLPATIPAAVVQRQLLPLIMDGREKEAVDLLHRIVLPPLSKDDLKTMPLLGQFAVYLGEPDSGLTFVRRHIDALLKFANFWEVEQGIRAALTLHWARFSPEHQRALIGHLADKVAGDFKKNAAAFKILVSLEEFKSGKYLTEKQMDEAIKKVAKSNYQNILPLALARNGEERIVLLKTVFEEVPRARRTNMLIDLIVLLPSAPDPKLVTFLRSKISSSVASVRRPMSIFQFDSIMAQSPDYSFPLLFEVFTSLAKEKPDHLPYLVLQAQLAQHVDGVDAVEFFDQAFKAIIENGKIDDWITSRCLTSLIQDLSPDKGKKIIAFMVKARAEGEPVSEMAYSVQMAILQKMQDMEGVITVAKSAQRQYPKTQFFRREIYRLLQTTGRVWESLDALSDEIKETSVTKWRRRQAYQSWKKQRNPIRAREFLEGEEGVSGGNSAPGKLLHSNVELVRNALAKDDMKTAALEFRRVWRYFGRERQFFVWRPIQVEWEKQESKSVGGLQSILGSEDTETRISAFSAVADLSFGESELRRQLRSMESSSLDWAGAIQEGLSKALVARLGVAGAIDSLRHEIRQGQADANTYALLLKILEKNAGAHVEGATDMLRDFAKTLSPNDDSKTKNLAEVLAAINESDSSARLYRWVMLRLGTVKNSFFTETPDLDAVISETATRFDEPTKRRFLTTVLETEEGDVAPYGKEIPANRMLDLWGKLGSATDALSSNRTLCEDLAGEFDEDVSPESYLAATKLWLGASDIENALACLKNALCREDTSTNFRRLRWCRETFSVPATKDSFEAKWGLAASAGITAWRNEGQISERPANRVLAIIAERLARVELHDDAAKILADVEPRLRTFSNDRLLIADVARVNRNKTLALNIEVALLKDRRLDLSRVYRALVHVHKTEGAEVAWDLGKTIMRYTLDPEVLRELLVCSKELGLANENIALRTKAKLVWPGESF